MWRQTAKDWSICAAFWLAILILGVATYRALPAQDQAVQAGQQQVLVQGPEAALIPADPATTGQSQQLQTVIQDPQHPAEPWIVTTWRRDGESVSAFIMRHREMVDAVREELNR